MSSQADIHVVQLAFEHTNANFNMFDFCTLTVSCISVTLPTVDTSCFGDLAKLAITIADIDRFY